MSWISVSTPCHIGHSCAHIFLVLDDGTRWDTLPLAHLIHLNSFVLVTNVMDWKADEYTIVQEGFIGCMRALSPTVSHLHLRFNLADICLAHPECLLSKHRWQLLDRILAELPHLHLCVFAFTLKLDIVCDQYASTPMDTTIRSLIAERLCLTRCKSVSLSQLPS